MHTFQPQSIANMIWAYATKGEPPEPAYLQVRVVDIMVSADESVLSLFQGVCFLSRQAFLQLRERALVPSHCPSL